MARQGTRKPVQLPLFGPRAEPPERLVLALFKLLLDHEDDRRAMNLLRGLRRFVRTVPDLAEAFDVPPPKPRSRRKAPRSLDPVQSLNIALAIDLADFKLADVLRALRRPPEDSRSYYRWLKRRLVLGRSYLSRSDRDELASLPGILRSLGRDRRKSFLLDLFGKRGES
ncbi:MAG: hypothetical protein ACE5FK_07390 [Candidatus Methylomirabilia bacterium]